MNDLVAMVRWIAAICLLAVASTRPAMATTPVARPNVVFIIVDDLNDYTGFLGGHPQASTPNMDALAARSTSFTDAYATLPICAPSRASLFTGVQPFRSGSLSFGEWFRNDRLKNSRTMMEYFRLNGYRTLGTGKLFHHNVGYIWDEFHGKVDYGPVWMEAGKLQAHPSVPQPYAQLGEIDGSFAPITGNGIVDEDGRPYSGWWSIPYHRPVRLTGVVRRDLLPDEISAGWAAQRINEMAEAGESQPFFLAVGFLRPHTPLHVPQEYFDRLPPESEILIPNYDPLDARDTHYRDVFDSKTRGVLLFDRLNASYPTVEQGLRAFIRAYLAAVAFADDQVGTVMRALENSPYADNTIVVLTSDHGWTFGEKDHLFKNNLWHSATRVPLLVAVPGQGAQKLAAPVSQIDLYPTLRELARLKGDTRKNKRGHPLDGKSLVPYMLNGAAAAPEFAVAMLKATNSLGARSNAAKDQHYSLITPHWRYIRYNTGQEELYDRRSDPRERTNLATAPQVANQLSQLRSRLVDAVGLPQPTKPPAKRSVDPSKL